MTDRGTSWVYRLLMAASLVYIMLRPVSSGNILYPILAVMAVTSIGALIIGRGRASREVSGVILIALVTGAYGSFVGMNNPGVEQHAIVWMVTPLVFGIWALAADERMIGALLRAAAWATIALSILILLFVWSEMGIVPSLIPEWLLEQTNAGFADEGGATAIRLYGLSTLVAAAPMWTVAAMLPNHPLMPRRVVRVLTAATAIGAALVGGRNAIVLVLVLVPVLVFVIRAIVRRKRAVPIGVWYLGTLVILALPIAIPTITNSPVTQRTLQSVVDYFAGNAGQSERTGQADQLLLAWSQSPIFGHGFGAVIPGYARSADRPWNFELQYHMLLFQTGIVGVLLATALVFAGIRALIRAWRARPDLGPVIVATAAGAAAMLVANATNPYLQAPGHAWAIWLPLLVANVALITPAPATTKATASAPTRATSTLVR